MDLTQFRNRFESIKQRGWICSLRKGPTGIGYTLEHLLGVKENNIIMPDLGNIEIKAHRIGSSSMITLFTFNRKVWIMKPLEAIKNMEFPMKTDDWDYILLCPESQTALDYFYILKGTLFLFVIFQVML